MHSCVGACSLICRLLPCFHSPKIGLSHTDSGGVTQTDHAGVTHTAKVVQEEGKKKGTVSLNRHSPVMSEMSFRLL